MAHKKADDRRREFIDTAARVIAADGVAKATTRRITEEAGAPTASLHYVFDGKDALLQAVLEQGPIDGQAAGARFVTPGMGLAAGVAALMRGYAGWVVDDVSWQQAQYELVLWAARTPSAKHLPGRVYRSYLDHTAQLLREATRPDDPVIDYQLLATHMLAVLDGLTLQAIAGQVRDLLAQTEIASANLVAWVERAAHPAG
ncbi:TetR/AcrR family transcriptional regulator [Gordonia sp. TBRC 11910]|uniref:TetR/AcrR family transcriptional regulator n=1 Tax=Gordonia asplenii TaxID=2725283 RepID=A0A848KTI2_9ACTN|nr:TetR/AcrR family transcriptional regulator [Gordonia asplenii]NMO02244.1 TetR/AcrR family transcriptional regulator [Gordonia asplenii]